MPAEIDFGYLTQEEALAALGIVSATDPKLVALAGLSWGANAGKYLRVNATENGWEFATASGGVSDGDKGDIIVSGGGATFTIDAGVVTLPKMANMATASLIYRKTAGSGPPEVQTLATLKTDLSLTGTNSGDQTSVTGNAGTATALQTARTIDGVSFNGTSNVTIIAPATVAATAKTTPVDADVLPIADSAASNVLKKLSWANIKATLKTYFDALYVAISTSSWTSTTATVAPGSGAFGATVTATITYRIINKVAFLEVDFTISDNGTAASWIDVTLPAAVTAAAGFHILTARECAIAGFMTCAALFNGTTLRFQRSDGSYPGATGYRLCASGSYQAV